MNNRFSRRSFLVKSLVALAAVSVGGLSSTRAQNAPFTGQQLLIDFEINRPNGGKYHRPYVAVWIENSSGQIVKTLAIWSQDRQYLRELLSWFNKTRGTASPTVSGPTRNAGAYQLIWDGTDNKGAIMAQDDYFICLEAAREKGTYQLIREKLSLSNAPFKRSLTGNTEIKAVGLDYR